MPVSFTPVFPQAPKVGLIQILPADTTTKKTVVTAGANGSKVIGLTATSTDTTLAHDLTITITRSATNYDIGTVAIPIGAGAVNSTALAVNLLLSTSIPGLPIDSDGNEFIFLQSGDTLTVSSNTTITAAKIVNLVAQYSDF